MMPLEIDWVAETAAFLTVLAVFGMIALAAWMAEHKPEWKDD